MIKTCRQCGQPAEHYQSAPTECKECWKNRVRANRAANVEHYRAYDINRRKIPKRLTATALMAAKTRRENPEIRSAQLTARKAIRNGTLVRPDHCSRCLIPCFPHAHHDDHRKPLEVMWLCYICHSARHREIGHLGKHSPRGPATNNRKNESPHQTEAEEPEMSKPWYVSYHRLGCTIIYAKTQGAASRRGREVFNRLEYPDVRPANQGDIDGVRAFGGRIHDEPRKALAPITTKQEGE